jgi:hypothetical protein
MLRNASRCLAIAVLVTTDAVLIEFDRTDP